MLRTIGNNQTFIASVIGVNKSTVRRELKRNVPKRGIGSKINKANKARQKTEIRHKEKPKQVLFSDSLKVDVVKKMTGEKLMTFDNDQALGLHHEIAKELNIKTFLRDPIHHKIKKALKIEMV